VLSAIQSLLVVVVALVSVSFYTLLERKLLGSAHLRLGPNILGWGGLLQPFADALKLFSKEWFVPRPSNVILFQLSPLLVLVFSLLLWVMFPLPSLLFSFKYLLLLFFSFTTFSSLCLLLSGWSSNSSYSLAGALRGVAQTISYEVSLIFLFILVMLLGMGVGLQRFQMHQRSFSWGWLVSPFLLL
jgi:NADH:ubiquinone oxidoreductase subunit H